MRKCDRAKKAQTQQTKPKLKKKKTNRIVSEKKPQCSLDAHYYLQQMSAEAQGLLIVAQCLFC